MTLIRFGMVGNVYGLSGPAVPGAEVTHGNTEDIEEEIARHDDRETPAFYGILDWPGVSGGCIPTIRQILRCRRCGRYARPWAPETGHDYADPSADPLYGACPDARRA